jgi:hypothetical protein
MAKKPNGKGGRGITNINLTANTVARPTARLVTYTPILNPYLNEDRRFYQPDRSIRPLGAVTRTATRIVARDVFGDKIRRQTKAPLTFDLGDRIHLCVRRKIRKSVIHALGIAGPRRGRTFKKPTRNFWSAIKC